MFGRLGCGLWPAFDFFFASVNSLSLPPKSASNGDQPGSLEILLGPLVDAVERQLQILQRIGHAEAKVAFPEFSECRARERGYSGLFEKNIRQRFGLPSCLGDVGEDVEGAFGHTA